MFKPKAKKQESVNVEKAISKFQNDQPAKRTSSFLGSFGSKMSWSKSTQSSTATHSTFSNNSTSKSVTLSSKSVTSSSSQAKTTASSVSSDKSSDEADSMTTSFRSTTVVKNGQTNGSIASQYQTAPSAFSSPTTTSSNIVFPFPVTSSPVAPPVPSRSGKISKIDISKFEGQFSKQSPVESSWHRSDSINGDNASSTASSRPESASSSSKYQPVFNTNTNHSQEVGQQGYQHQTSIQQKYNQLLAENENALRKLDSFDREKCRMNDLIVGLKSEASKLDSRHREEMEDLKSQMKKKISMLERLVEDEADEKSKYLKQVKDLERRLNDTHHNVVEPCNLKTNSKYNQLKEQQKYLKALLKDSQMALEQHKKCQPNNQSIERLKHELEQSSSAYRFALRQTVILEHENSDLNKQLNTLEATKLLAEEQCSALRKEKTKLENLFNDKQHELDQVVRKLREQFQHNEYGQKSRRLSKVDQDLCTPYSKCSEIIETPSTDREKLAQLEACLRDCENKLEFEGANKLKLETCHARLKAEIDGLQEQLQNFRLGREKDANCIRDLQFKLSKCQDTLLDAQKAKIDAEERLKKVCSKMDHYEEKNVALQSALELSERRLDTLRFIFMKELEADKENGTYSSSDDEGYSKASNSSLRFNGDDGGKSSRMSSAYGTTTTSRSLYSGLSFDGDN